MGCQNLDYLLNVGVQSPTDSHACSHTDSPQVSRRHSCRGAVLLLRWSGGRRPVLRTLCTADGVRRWLLRVVHRTLAKRHRYRNVCAEHRRGIDCARNRGSVRRSVVPGASECHRRDGELNTGQFDINLVCLDPSGSCTCTSASGASVGNTGSSPDGSARPSRCPDSGSRSASSCGCTPRSGPSSGPSSCRRTRRCTRQPGLCRGWSRRKPGPHRNIHCDADRNWRRPDRARLCCTPDRPTQPERRAGRRIRRKLEAP